MHGIILNGLKKFVVDSYDHATWEQIRSTASVENTLYVPVTEYPDEHVQELVATASELSDEPAPALLRSFGRYVVPILVQFYGVHIDDGWDGLDLVENVEASIHEALRAKNISEFDPPEIFAERTGPDEVVVYYGSDRELCDVARGILEGVADHYEESWDITERNCMHDGADRCEIRVRRTGGAGA